ncbi:MAG: hypothetical protein ACREBK_07555 [Sphingomicrobium sp.]
MRLTILLGLAPLLMAASPPPAEPAPADALGEIQRALDDPRHDQKIPAMIEALTETLLNLKVGEFVAVADGRKPTAADRKLTVRDIARRDDPRFEEKLRGQVAGSGPAIRQGMKSLAAALPALVKSFEEAGAAIERATANLPDPTYPKR